MRTLVISDIHGCYQEFIKMLEKIELTKEDKLIILGDLVDRGPHSMKVILKINRMRKDEYKIITIEGNHEEMFQYAIKKYRSIDEVKLSSDYEILKSNGTLSSLVDYYNLNEQDRFLVREEMRNLNPFYGENDYLFVHAGVIPNITLSKQDFDDFKWVREEFIGQPHNLPYIVVFGHTPTPYLNPGQEYKIFHGEDKIGMDCGCVFGGKLACLDITNNIEYYVSRIAE